MAAHISHLVVPGQVIATTASEGEGGFLRGHGTYIETVSGLPGSSSLGPKKVGPITMENEPSNSSRKEEEGDDGEMEVVEESSPQRLVASVAGTVERVNKLISVIPTSPSLYVGQVGDLVIGRVTSVGATRWKVSLSSTPGVSREGQLPLSGVNLPGGVQRIRTAEDALGMRRLYSEGDLVSAEVQSVQHDGTLLLHTRSLRYGKLENGCVVSVPPALMKRMQVHFVTLDADIGVDVLLGCNGSVWVQRTVPQSWKNEADARVDDEKTAAPLAETLQKLRQRHADTAVLPDEREAIARVRNAVELLGMVYCRVTPENITAVYRSSLGEVGDKQEAVGVGDMMRPEMVVRLTACTRS